MKSNMYNCDDISIQEEKLVRSTTTTTATNFNINLKYTFLIIIPYFQPLTMSFGVSDLNRDISS